MPADNDALAEILQRLTRIEAMIATEGARCPHREDIARAMNSIQERKALALRVDKIEDHLTDARISIARMLATGGAGGVIGTVLVELVKSFLDKV
jgi:hypothetical protein